MDKNLKDILVSVWKMKFSILFITITFSLMSVYYALQSPNLYISNAILLPMQQEDKMNNAIAKYSSAASLAGINLPTSSFENVSNEAIARVKSFSFFRKYFLPFIKLEDLFAATNWNSQNNLISYDEKIFNKTKNQWVRNVSPPLVLIPTEQEAYEVYKKTVAIYKDEKTSFVHISTKHVSPNIAEQWTNLIIKNINESMREIDKTTVLKSIEFLNKIYNETSLSDTKDAISNLLEKQIQDLMFISANENYVFKILEDPISPEKRSSPNRFLILFFGTFLGFIFGVFFSLIFSFVRQLNLQKN